MGLNVCLTHSNTIFSLHFLVAPLYFFPSIFSSLGSLSAAGLFVAMVTFLLLLMKGVLRRVDVISPNCCVQIHELNSLAVFRVTGSPPRSVRWNVRCSPGVFSTRRDCVGGAGSSDSCSDLQPALALHSASSAGSTFLLPDFLPEDLKTGPRPRMRKHPVRPLEERTLQRGQTAQSLTGPVPTTRSRPGALRWHKHEPACLTAHKHNLANRL